MNKLDYKRLAICYKALGDETRSKIFDMLKCESMCACRILAEFKFTQPTLSYHMKQLVDAGLVKVTKSGTWNYYSIDCHTVFDMRDFLSKKYEDCKCLQNEEENLKNN